MIEGIRHGFSDRAEYSGDGNSPCRKNRRAFSSKRADWVVRPIAESARSSSASGEGGGTWVGSKAMRAQVRLWIIVATLLSGVCSTLAQTDPVVATPPPPI